MSFKKLIPAKNIKQCSLPAKSYSTIQSTETFNNHQISRCVHWLCEPSKNGYIFTILDGSTGHERWYLKDLVEILSEETESEIFIACAGSSGYPTLELDRMQIKAVVMSLEKRFLSNT